MHTLKLVLLVWIIDNFIATICRQELRRAFYFNENLSDCLLLTYKQKIIVSNVFSQIRKQKKKVNTHFMYINMLFFLKFQRCYIYLFILCLKFYYLLFIYECINYPYKYYWKISIHNLCSNKYTLCYAWKTSERDIFVQYYSATSIYFLLNVTLQILQSL